MSKIKHAGLGLGLGLLTAGTATFGTSASSENDSRSSNDSTIRNEITLPSPLHSDTITEITKRQAEKIYHRFEDIPAIADDEVHMYDKSEYTYIINADLYQKSGEIELKRVLTGEITQANLLSLIYRSECGSRIPQENEDHMTQYVIDFKLINPTGTYKGPSQMDDIACTSFIKYLAINPSTRENVLPLLEYKAPAPRNAQTPQSLEAALVELEKICYDDSLQLLPIDQRKCILGNKVYQNIRLKNDAWAHLASAELKNYFVKEENKRRKEKTLRGDGFTNTTKNFLCLTELFPNKQQLTQELETYNLTTYPIGRVAAPKQIMMALALSMNLKNNEGNLNATRIPMYAIAASISTVNWHGNGLEALKDAKGLRETYQNNPDRFPSELVLTAKKWTAGKSRKYGVNELKEMNMITPILIEQFQTMELPGASELAMKYGKAVECEESKAQFCKQKFNFFVFNANNNNFNL